jgi:hypothetical protein
MQFTVRHLPLQIWHSGPRAPARAGTRNPPGSADQWAIGICKASSGHYSETELCGSFGPATGTPERGIDDIFIL